MKHWYDRVPRTMGDWWLLTAGGGLILLAVALLPRAAGALGYLLGLLAPFAGGLVLAYVLDIPTRFFAQKLFRGRRGPAIALAYLALLAAVVVLVWLVVPQLWQSVTSFAANLPAYTQTLTGLLALAQERLPINADKLAGLLQDSGAMLQQLLDGVVGNAPQIAGAAAGAAGSVMNVFLALAASVYMLSGKEEMLRDARLALRAALPPKAAANVLSVFTLANRTFSGYIGGQLLDALLVGIETFVLMTVLGLDFAPMIGVLVGVTNIIPILGPFIGAVPGAIILLLSSPLQAVEFVIVVLVVQQIDGNFIAPRILGGATGLSGLWVMLAILVGGELFGLAGMLAGVPVLAVLATLARQAVGAGLSARGIDPSAGEAPPAPQKDNKNVTK